MICSIFLVITCALQIFCDEHVLFFHQFKGYLENFNFSMFKH